MSVIPITVAPESVHINADRRLVFEVVTAFGAAQGDGEGANRVLRDEGNRKLVQFVTPVSLGFGWTHRFVTTEWVAPTEPEQITFELVPGEGPVTGGLKLLRDRFTFADMGSCTEMTYESTFGIRWWYPGWLLGKIWFERYMTKHMRHHLQELKSTVEARAQRSRVYPQAACTHAGQRA